MINDIYISLLSRYFYFRSITSQQEDIIIYKSFILQNYLLTGKLENEMHILIAEVFNYNLKINNFYIDFNNRICFQSNNNSFICTKLNKMKL